MSGGSAASKERSPRVVVRDADFTLYCGDALETLRALDDGCVDCCVTSPPYFNLRDYGVDGQIGLEATVGEYVASLVAVFAEARRVLADSGTLWLNLGDSYASSTVAPSPARERLEWIRVEYGEDDIDYATFAPLVALEGALKHKDMCGIPWRVAFALQADGWYLRSDNIWAKPNAMPESVTDRPTKAHEYVFLLAKSPTYFFDQDAVREDFVKTGTIGHLRGGGGKRAGTREGLRAASYGIPDRPQEDTLDGSDGEAPRGPDGRRVTRVEGRDGSLQHRNGARWPTHGKNIRTVWEIPTQPYAEAHFATYPEELVRRCILAGCPEGGTVLDPFLGSGTTALVARRHGRRSVGVELNPKFADMAAERLGQQSLLAEGAA